jgi:hypothetical protein
MNRSPSGLPDPEPASAVQDSAQTDARPGMPAEGDQADTAGPDSDPDDRYVPL